MVWERNHEGREAGEGDVNPGCILKLLALQWVMVVKGTAKTREIVMKFSLNVPSWEIVPTLRAHLGPGPSDEALEILADEIMDVGMKSYVRGYKAHEAGEHLLMDVIEEKPGYKDYVIKRTEKE